MRYPDDAELAELQGLFLRSSAAVEILSADSGQTAPSRKLTRSAIVRPHHDGIKQGATCIVGVAKSATKTGFDQLLAVVVSHITSARRAQPYFPSGRGHAPRDEKDESHAR